MVHENDKNYPLMKGKIFLVLSGHFISNIYGILHAKYERGYVAKAAKSFCSSSPKHTLGSSGTAEM